MATPLLALVMPPLEAAAIMLPIMIVQDAAALWVYRKDWSGRIVTIMMPGAIAGVAIAGVLAAHISDDAVRVFIAVFTIGFVLWTWIGPAQIAREAGSPAWRAACSGARCRASPRPSARPARRPIRCTCWRRSCRK